jgi:hypothetical protein
MADRIVRTAADLHDACAAAQPGDVIRVHARSYPGPTPAKLQNVKGTAARPLVICAADDGWISGAAAPDPLWGEQPPAIDAPSKPSTEDFGFLVIIDCAHVVIEGLKLREFWPSILSIKHSHHLTIRNCTFRHGTYAIFAKSDRDAPGKTSHLLIEGNEWQQDDSPEHALWTRIDWARAHGDEDSDGLFRYYNGGFLSTKGIAGQVVVRGNRIMDAYNGVRMKGQETPSGTEPPRHVNADVHIFDNDFIRIRDNPIEPEASAWNWHVRHNRLVDCHSWFSVDGVRGGYWYIYGNTGRFDSRQGEPGQPAHTMGRVLKLSYAANPPEDGMPAVPDAPWYVFNNSWHLRCPIVGGANPTLSAFGEGPDFTANLDFFNNAFTWCSPVRDGAWVCQPIEMLRHFDLANSPGTTFAHDICDREDFFAELARQGRPEANGIPAKRPIFRNAPAGNFALATGSEAQGTGWVRSVCTNPEIEVSLRPQADATLNRGALQDYGLIQVPDLEAQADALLAEIGAEP